MNVILARGRAGSVRHRSIARIASGVVSVSIAIAAPASAQTLDSLVRQAIDGHPSVEAARTAIRQSDARARAAAAWEPPAIGLEFDMLPPTNPNPFAKGETMLMVEQMIPLFGQNRLMERAMRLGAEVGEADLAVARRELRARVEREYITLWLLDRRDALNVENRKLLELLQRSAETRYAVDRGRQSDILRITLEIERLHSERGEIGEERSEALARLNALLGRPPATPVTIAADLANTELAPAQLPSLDSLGAAIESHPALRRMRAMARMSEAEAEAEQAMSRPMLMLRGGIAYLPEGHPVREGNLVTEGHGGTAEPMEEGVMRLGLRAGFMLTLPDLSWSRGGPEGRAEVKRLEATGSLLEIEVMRREMLGELGAAWSMARRAALRLKFYRATRLPLLEQTLESLTGEYAGNRVAFSSVIDGYSMLVMARMDAFMQQMEYAMALSMITEMTTEATDVR